MSYRLKAVTHAEPLPFVAAQPSVSHRQVPAWGEAEPDWRAERLGWFDEDDRLVGAGLVLLRPLPKLKRYLAYLPEGPVIDWAATASAPGSEGSGRLAVPCSESGGFRGRRAERRPGGCGRLWHHRWTLFCGAGPGQCKHRPVDVAHSRTMASTPSRWTPLCAMDAVGAALPQDPQRRQVDRFLLDELRLVVVELEAGRRGRKQLLGHRRLLVRDDVVRPTARGDGGAQLLADRSAGQDGPLVLQRHEGHPMPGADLTWVSIAFMQAALRLVR